MNKITNKLLLGFTSLLLGLSLASCQDATGPTINPTDNSSATETTKPADKPTDETTVPSTNLLWRVWINKPASLPDRPSAR